MIRRLSPLLLACAALAAGLSLARAAGADAPAEEPSRFTVVAAPDDRFAQRVLAELSSLGFEAVRLDPPDEPASRVALEAAAREAGALAAIRAVPSERGIEVWIADRMTGKTVVRHIPVDPEAPEPEPALAIRAVELLRASILEASLPEPPPGEVPAPPAVREKLAIAAPAAPEPPPPRPPPALRFALSIGVLASPGGFDPAAALDVGVGWIPIDHIGFCAFASIPLSRPRVEGSAGSADLATVMAGGGIRFVLTEQASAWTPSVDMGLTAITLQLTGSANEGFAAGDRGAWTAAPYVRAGLAFAANPMLRVRADVLATGIFQGVAVRLAGEKAATFGEPIVVTSAGVDFGWF